MREAERQGIFSEYKDREGTLVRALVHRIEKRTVILDMGRTEAVLPARARHSGLPGEQYKARNILRTEIRSRDVAELVCALCGAAFARTTGAQVPIDGGNERIV